MMRCGRTPRYLVLMTVFFFLVVSSSFAQDQQSSPESNSPYREEIKMLAERILKRADKAKCHPNSCTILVANFTAPSGSTSRLGIQLADSTSAELLATASGIQVVDRSRLRDYLMRERIPSNLLKGREAARWLAGQFQANAVLIGTIEQQVDHLNLLVELLNISDDKVGPQEAVQIAIPDPQEAFAPFEPYSAEGSDTPAALAQASTPVRAGVNGVSVPTCSYCPIPPYSDAARKAKSLGKVVLLVTITAEGRAANISVLKGVPFGSNEAAIKALSSWKFRPAIYGGKPIATLVPIEITFRLY
jgi:TonB family protein